MCEQNIRSTLDMNNVVLTGKEGKRDSDYTAAPQIN